MAVPRKLVVVPNAATRDLWRIAEVGEIDELEAVLSRADINARNEHGMTALMRAAYHGRVEMVRVLLEHGADPNVARNDNFTALSLAAFFGHADIVDVLMGHGAKTDVATRFGTSPYLWARARCFGDVARSLEKRDPEPKARVFAKPVAPLRVEEPDSGPILVRTLKDPPEIWDLVHEAPRKFDARAAFFARMGSFKGRLVMTVTLLVLIGVAVGLGFYLKNRASSVSRPAPTVVTTVPQPVLNQTPEIANVASEAPVVTTPPVTTVTSNTSLRRSRSFQTPYIGPTEINNEQTSVQTSEVNVVAPPTVIAAKPEPRSIVTGDTKKSTTPVSSEMLSPAKTAQTKAKVIQWP
jgi:hypothetical protein